MPSREADDEKLARGIGKYPWAYHAKSKLFGNYIESNAAELNILGWTS